MTGDKLVATDFPVPEGLEHEAFRLRMLAASDAEADYEAVMASAARLRAGSENGWPRIGFTLAENLADLERHEQEFYDRVAFAYTMVAPDESSVLGCVYFNPPTSPEADVNVHLWVRDEHHPALTRTLYEAVVAWLVKDWPFERIHWARQSYYDDAIGNG
ncbi:MAG: hypothetical protein AAGE43_00335 [Pseudomonadota bacterium]